MRPASLVTGTVDCHRDDVPNLSGTHDPHVAVSTYTLCPDNGGNSGIDYWENRSSSSSKVHSSSPYRWDSHPLPLSGLPYEVYSSSSQPSRIKLERLYVNNPNCQEQYRFWRANEMSKNIHLEHRLPVVSI